MKRKQNGFGIIEILLVAIILILVGFMGWYAWHNINSLKKVNSGSTKSIDKRNEENVPFTKIVRKNEQHDEEGYEINGNEITLYLGSKNTGGYGYEVEKVVKKSNDELTIFTIETRAGSRCSVTQAFTSPQVTIKLQELITKEITVSKSVKIEDC